MHNFMKKISLVFAGVIAGIMVSLNFSAIADLAWRAIRLISPDKPYIAGTPLPGTYSQSFHRPVKRARAGYELLTHDSGVLRAYGH